MLIVASKPDREIKCQIYNTLGKLSLLISREKMVNNVHSIMKIIKIDFEKYTTNLTLEIFECLASLMKNYKNIIFTNISYEDILNKMFSLGFAESQLKFLTQLLKYYEEKSPEHIKIIIVVLNVISFILCERSFHLRDTKNNLKNYNTDFLDGITSINKSLSTELNLDKSTVSASSDMMYESFNPKRTGPTIFSNKSFIKLPKQNITIYMSNLKNGNRYDEYRYIIRNALKFLGTISHEFFLKDILSFFQQYCLKYFEG